MGFKSGNLGGHASGLPIRIHLAGNAVSKNYPTGKLHCGGGEETSLVVVSCGENCTLLVIFLRKNLKCALSSSDTCIFINLHVLVPMQQKVSQETHDCEMHLNL
jgi:hypothetical protein